jgi:hypothetical protein
MTTNPTDAKVIPFPGARRRAASGKPQQAASPPSSPPVTDEPGALFEMPLRPVPRPRAAKPKPAPTGKPKRPREPKPEPLIPPRPALHEAGAEDELVEGIKRTRRVRVTFDATVHEAYYGLGRKLTLVVDLASGQRIAFGIADTGALVEVIERAEGETA